MRLVLLLASSVSFLAYGPAPVSAADPALASFSLSGSPFAEAFAPLPSSVTLAATLTRSAAVTVSIRRPSGALVRRLASHARKRAGVHTWTWDGRTDRGTMAGDGTYVARIVAVSGANTQTLERPLRKGLPPIYPQNPGAIVIVVDPGHGGRFPGAVNGEYQEKDFNLDIGLQLAALLERAGVQVVMTRTTDVAVNDPPSDANGDGVLDRYDDDLERTDIANEALADIAVHVHNNAAPNAAARGTEAFTDADRTWTGQGRELATDVLNGVVNSLEPYRSPSYQPKNAGIHTGWYYYMGPYDPPFLPRAALMTSVLSESLFISNASELEALKRQDVRLSIAAGIYLGVAEYLNSRPYGIGYELLSAPAMAAAGGNATYRVRVTNRGNSTSDGWTLKLAAVSAVPLYDGSGAHGSEIGSVAVPDGLQPGQSVDLSVDATAPADVGDWLVKSDVILRNGDYMSDAGVAPLQVALTTTIAP